MVKKLVRFACIIAVFAMGVATAEAKCKGGGRAPVEHGKLVGKEPDTSKPGKVFIMLGQSNMVGMSSKAEMLKNKK